MVEHLNPEEETNGNNDKKVSIKCQHCKSKNFSKQGYRKTQNRGKLQKYFCRDCHRYFTANTGFYRMRNSEKIITMSIDMYLSNLSSRKMRNQLKRHMDTKTSHVTVLDWVRRYVLKVQKYIDTLNPICESEVYADETEIKRGKNRDIFWCAVDWNSRYINATLYSPRSQNVVDATEFIKNIKKKSLPRFIQTDGLPFYPKAISKVFRSKRSSTEPSVLHIINNVSRTGRHNVRIETVFSKIKDRVHDFRGLKALWSAPILMAGIVLQHNFIEAHSTTGYLPSELAFMPLDTGVNRWLGLIRMATI